MLLEVEFKIGIIFGDEELVIDVAEVVEGVVATHAILFVLVILLAADFALPWPATLLLVFYSVCRDIICVLSLCFLN